jgi:hypothetical protein
MVMVFKKSACFSMILLLLISCPLYCKNLGVLGPVFEIKEKDMLEMITQKLGVMEDSGTIAYYQNQLLEKAKLALQTP